MAEAYNVEMGQRLAQIRRARGLTQLQLATLLHTDRHYLTKYETGRHAMSYALLTQAVRILGVSFDTVLDLCRPLPAYLRGRYAGKTDTLSWRIEGMLAEYRETGWFYLLYWGKERVCWVRHDPAASAIVLLSSFQPGGPEDVPQRYQADELAKLSAERIAAILMGL